MALLVFIVALEASLSVQAGGVESNHERRTLMRVESTREVGLSRDQFSIGNQKRSNSTAKKLWPWMVIHPQRSCENFWRYKARLTKKNMLYLNPPDPHPCGRFGTNSLNECKACCEKDSRCRAVDFFTYNLMCNMHEAACSPRDAAGSKLGASSHRLDSCGDSVREANFKLGSGGKSIIGTAESQKLESIDEAVKYVMDNCPAVEKLDVGQSKLSDAGLGHISVACGNLRSLKAGNTRLTDAGVSMLAQCCSNLDTIWLDNTSIADDGVKSLVLKTGALRAISLSNSHLTDAGAIYISAGCDELDYLSVSSTLVSDKGMLPIAEKCKKLRGLMVSGTLVSDKFFTKLGTNCQKLEVLSCFNCSSVTENAWTHILDECGSLKTIRFSPEAKWADTVTGTAKSKGVAVSK